MLRTTKISAGSFLLQVAVAMAGVLILGGCTPVTPREEIPGPTDLSQIARQVRPADPTREPFTFSNEARAIEEDLGIGQSPERRPPAPK